MQDITCKYCKRYLFKQAGTVVIEGLICPNSDCKAKLNFKIIQADNVKDITHKFVNPEREPKSKLEGKNPEITYTTGTTSTTFIVPNSKVVEVS